MTQSRNAAAPRVRLIDNPRVRSAVYQIVLCVVLAGVVVAAVYTAAENLARANVATGFGFWNQTAGFDISQTLIPYSASASTYGRAFWVGLLNTLLVAGLGIVFATILGFAIGIARLSQNFLVERLASGYVEFIRNIPLLLQLLFWYNAVLKALPSSNSSLAIPGGALLNNRGLFLPRPETVGLAPAAVALLLGLGAALLLLFVNRRPGGPSRRGFGWLVLAVVLVPPLATWLVTAPSLSFIYPEAGRFNVRGGIEVLPEFVALLFGLVLYTAAFIAEAVRAGLLAVPKGQTEAAHALGLRRGPTLRLIVIPQAMRVIVPPLTNQYLNLTKNSTLAVAIGYPDLVQIFAGTVLNITGQAVEVVFLTMAVYLVISLVTSFLMNWYNARLSLRER